MDGALSLRGLANFNRKEVTPTGQEESSSLASEVQCGMLARRGAPTAEALVDYSVDAMPCLLDEDNGSSSLESQPVQNLSSGFADVLSSVHELSSRDIPRGKSTTVEASSSKMSAKCKKESRRSSDEGSPAMEIQLQARVLARRAISAAPEPVMLQRRASRAPPPPIESAGRSMPVSMAACNDKSPVSAMLCRQEPNNEASILNSQAAQMLSGGFAEVIGRASEQTFDLDLSAPVCIIGLSVAVEEQMNTAVSWFLRSAGDVETSLRLQCGLQFEHKIEEAYQHWISSDSNVPFRLFRFHDPKGNNWHIIDLSSLTGTQAPAVEVLGRNFIDPQLVVFTQLRRESALQKEGDLALLFANSIRPHNECFRAAQAALDQYMTKCNI